MITTSSEEIDLSTMVNEEQKNQFLEDGFIRLDNVISKDELAWYSEFYDKIFSEGSIAKRKKLGGTDTEGRDALPQVMGPSNTYPELKDTPYLKRLLAIAQFILGPDAVYSHDHMILKPAGYGAVTPWHQDQAYHNPALYYTNINFWLPIEDATVENGCMHYVRGSHRGVVLPHKYLNDDPTAATVALGEDYWDANGTAVPCPAGSVALHHSYTLHYAGANRTERPRRAYIAIFKVDPQPRKYPLHFPWLKKKPV